MEIKSVILQTKDLVEMKSFYMNILGFPLINEDRDRFKIAIGTSELAFTSKEVEGNPYYHFAFNIPANKFNEAKAWIKRKVSLTVEDGKDEANFNHLSAHALYFYDPAGNIVEFIARHLVSEDSVEPFSNKGILNISEISLTVNDAIGAGEKLNGIDICERDNNPINTKQLNFMGEKAKGIFILLTQPGRKWLFSNKKSVIYPLEIVLTNNNRIKVDADNKLEVYRHVHDED